MMRAINQLVNQRVSELVSGLALTLFVAGVGANDADDAFAADDLAIFAKFFN